MNATQLRIIAIAVAALLVAWAASELLSRRSDRVEAAFRLPRVSATQTDTVTIWHGADSVALARHAGAWVVNGQPASTSAVSELFDALRDTASPEFAAQSPSSFARMGVDSAGARLVRVVAGETTALRIFVGGNGPGGDAAYLRLPGKTRVYLWPGRLGTLVARGMDDWRDRQIAAIVPDSVGELEITRGRTRLVVRRHGATWALGTGAPADSGAVAQLLEHFRSVSAAGFASPRQVDSLRFDHPQRRVALRSRSGRQLASLAFDSAASVYFVRAAAGGPVFRLDGWQADELTPLAAGLAAKAQPQPAPLPTPPATSKKH